MIADPDVFSRMARILNFSQSAPSSVNVTFVFMTRVYVSHFQLTVKTARAAALSRGN
jgi:hypothetical protein